MLTEEERKFVIYWEKNRLLKKKRSPQVAIGLSMASLLALLFVGNLLSGWYARADMVLQSNKSLVITILVAVLIIIVFIAIFSMRHIWEKNEQRYQEFLNKSKK